MVFIKNEKNKIKGVNWVEFLACAIVIGFIIRKGVDLVFWICLNLKIKG